MSEIKQSELVSSLTKQVESLKTLNLVVGQKVWVMPSKYTRGERTQKEATVSKIGRKYFELEGFIMRKYRISDGVEENNTNYKGKVYTNLQQILDEKEHAKISSELRKIFLGYGKLPYDLAILKKIRDLLQDNNA